jgi:type II secretory pathway component PulL
MRRTLRIYEKHAIVDITSVDYNTPPGIFILELRANDFLTEDIFRNRLNKGIF